MNGLSVLEGFSIDIGFTCAMRAADTNSGNEDSLGILLG